MRAEGEKNREKGFDFSASIAVVVLNWNGWKDTIECLTSLLMSSYKRFSVVLVENGSEDDSLERLMEWSEGRIGVVVGPYGKEEVKVRVEFINSHKMHGGFSSDRIILIRNSRNLGYAGGCNVGIRYALSNDFDYIMLLNNDTTVESDCLKRLSDFLNNNTEYHVATPMICYYDRPDRIWNCGGRLTMRGSKRYYFSDKRCSEVRQNNFKKITFITGCGLFARSKIFKEYGLLSERFFFGEEDYEFSLRMKKNRIGMAAVMGSKIFHKVAATMDNLFVGNRLAHAYIALLNRYIDMKTYYPRWYFRIWRVLSFIYIIPMFMIKYKANMDECLLLCRNLLKESKRLDYVKRDEVLRAIELFK